MILAVGGQFPIYGDVWVPSRLLGAEELT